MITRDHLLVHAVDVSSQSSPFQPGGFFAFVCDASFEGQCGPFKTGVNTYELNY